MPKDCSEYSYWSDQNEGIAVNGPRSTSSPASSAASVCPARRPVSVGMFQCSMRRGTGPNSALGCRATSPTATTGARSVATCIAESTSTPSDRSSPLPCSQLDIRARCRRPRSRRRPAARCRRSASRSGRGRRRGTRRRSGRGGSARRAARAVGAWRPRASAPSGRIIGSSSRATTVTSAPSARAVAAVSHPMKPAPMMRTCTPGARRARSRSASVDRAQHRPAVRGSGDRQASRPDARGDHESVELEDRPVVERHGARREIG